MGFDVLYLPPIHPIGRDESQGKEQRREGRCRKTWAARGRSEPAKAGTKPSIRNLGTLEDFKQLAVASQAVGPRSSARPGLPVRARPSLREGTQGMVSHASRWHACSTRRIRPRSIRTSIPSISRPKKARSCGKNCRSVVLYWIEQGVRIFRVDNPHTKPFDFWEWLITDIKSRHPDVLFLAEAFTRPKVMYELAKLGFTQSYTYFAWRNTKRELTEYFKEITQTDVREYFRAQSVAQYSRHPHRISAAGRTPGVHDPAGAGRDARRELWNLRSRFRAGRKPRGACGKRRVSRLGEISDPQLGSGQSRQPGRVDHQSEPDSPRKPGAAE